jgi:hypothetical protein
MGAVPTAACATAAATRRSGPSDVRARRNYNWRPAVLLNSQRVTVAKVQRNGRLQLSSGREIRSDFRTFTYGHCVTSPSAQGKPVDHVYLAMDAQ